MAAVGKINHAKTDITGENRVGGLVAEFLGVALVVAGQAEEPAEHFVERPLAGRRCQAHVLRDQWERQIGPAQLENLETHLAALAGDPAVRFDTPGWMTRDLGGSA